MAHCTWLGTVAALEDMATSYSWLVRRRPVAHGLKRCCTVSSAETMGVDPQVVSHSIRAEQSTALPWPVVDPRTAAVRFSNSHHRQVRAAHGRRTFCTVSRP